jgi:hypothetical protein
MAISRGGSACANSTGKNNSIAITKGAVINDTHKPHAPT